MPGVYPRYSKKTGELLHYVIWWKDEKDERCREKGPRDKAAAKRIAHHRQNRVELIKEGIIDPREEAFAGYARQPAIEILDEYIATRVQVTKRRRRDIRSHMGRIFHLGGIAALGELKKDRVEKALALIIGEGAAPATYNRYRAIARAFSKWCWEADRLRSDPLKAILALNEEASPTFTRRTIGVDELARLIRVTAGDPGDPRLPRKADGPTRALVYRLAVATGLRHNEIRMLKVGRLDLGSRPAVLVEAGQAKNRRSAWQPIPESLARDLRAYVAEKPANKPLFVLPRHGAAMIRKDLKLAGIPFEDEQGRRFDFHCLRSELATLADAQGVPLGISQKLMRHSTPTLTARYTRHGDEALVRAVESLPIPLQDGSLARQPDDPGGEADCPDIPEEIRAVIQALVAAGKKMRPGG